MPRGVIKIGERTVSARILAARLTGRVSGLGLNLSEAQASAQLAAARCESALADGETFLTADTMKSLHYVKNHIDAIMITLSTLRCVAERLDEETRRACARS